MLPKYSDYINIFSSKLIIEPSKNININKYIIELVEAKQSPYRPIYAFSPVELKTLKAYIKTYLKTKFTKPLKCLIGASIIFDKKPNGRLYLYINNQNSNNLAIKN